MHGKAEGCTDTWNVTLIREGMHGYVKGYKERYRDAWKDRCTCERMNECVKGRIDASKDECI
jgi:hypothetical protein